ncbi:early transcribed membrane protein [Plasmodium relictum]|uniref:Early transcribed membrane protein n=1 Tax=Plasmodium relictum TaxID=85471 RepID=A0A1J1H2E7_PLARL|nr:early transcribed membrane protein [Plasmodium relictum]CRG99027.1 early transcribed membrane protein [Plasmodium relictum]
MKTAKIFFFFIFLLFINLLLPCLCNDLGIANNIDSLEKIKKEMQKKKKIRNGVIIGIGTVLTGLLFTLAIGLGIRCNQNMKCCVPRKEKKTYTEKSNEPRTNSEGTNIRSRGSTDFKWKFDYPEATYKELKKFTFQKLKNKINDPYSDFNSFLIDDYVRDIFQKNDIYISSHQLNDLAREARLLYNRTGHFYWTDYGFWGP